MIREIIRSKNVPLTKDKEEAFFKSAEPVILKLLIELKLICRDAQEHIQPEDWNKIQTQLGQAFDQEETLRLMKSLDADTTLELDRKLSEFGSSRDLARKAYFEKCVYAYWLGEVLKEHGITKDSPSATEYIAAYQVALRQKTPVWSIFDVPLVDVSEPDPPRDLFSGTFREDGHRTVRFAKSAL